MVKTRPDSAFCFIRSHTCQPMGTLEVGFAAKDEKCLVERVE